MIFAMIISLILGIGIGYYELAPFFNDYINIAVQILLFAMLFMAGVNIGGNKKVFVELKQIGFQILWLPFVIIVGSWLGSLILSLFIDLSVPEILAISSGMGYYSISSIILTSTAGATMGAIAFLSNLMREVITLIMTPYFSRKSFLALIACGGATTKDTTLPVILQYAPERIVSICIISGIIITVLVPFMVSFFASMI